MVEPKANSAEGRGFIDERALQTVSPETKENYTSIVQVKCNIPPSHMKCLFTVGTCAVFMLPVALRAYKNEGFYSTFYSWANRISGVWARTWVWMGNGKKPFRNVSAPLCRPLFACAVPALQWMKHPSPRDEKQGDKTSEVRNELCPDCALDFLTTDWSRSSWDGACSVRAQTSFTSLSPESFPWWETQPFQRQDPTLLKPSK